MSEYQYYEFQALDRPGPAGGGDPRAAGSTPGRDRSRLGDSARGGSRQARRCARDAGTPCVFLKAGYNPEQIAEVVRQQASEQPAHAISPR